MKSVAALQSVARGPVCIRMVRAFPRIGKRMLNSINSQKASLTTPEIQVVYTYFPVGI
jgi:hypothetical protein